MHSEPVQIKSTINVKPSQQDDQQPELISVKEAAQRLRISKSTAYRIDRKDGPFRFVTSGRRVFIDLKSLDDYLDTETPSQTIPIPEQLQPQSHIDIEQTRKDVEIQTRDSNRLPNENLAPRDCGQRELILPHRQSFFVVMYVA